jgi:hypothetical protein
MAEHEVRFLVRGIVTVNVQANSLEQAMATAERKRNRKFFLKSKGVEVLEERSEICGVDNLDLWGKTSD